MTIIIFKILEKHAQKTYLSFKNETEANSRLKLGYILKQ